MFNSILVPVDPAQPSSWSKALPVALSLRSAAQARLTLLTVIPDLKGIAETEWSKLACRYLMDSALLKLEEVMKEYPDAADAAIEIATGKVWRGILDGAQRAEADLIVLASHRPAMKDYLIGANAVSVVRHAPCSVLVVRD